MSDLSWDDLALLAELRCLLQRVDPVPADVHAAAEAAGLLLTATTVLVRGGDRGRGARDRRVVAPAPEITDHALVPAGTWRELLNAAVRDPDATLRRTDQLLATRRIDAGWRAGAWHAAALARFERGEPALAVRAARRARAGAERAGNAAHVAELHLLLAWIEQDRGNPKASVAHLDLAQPRLRGRLLARARCLRGLNLCVTGGYEAAHRELSAAIVGLRRHGEERWLANALIGRGVVRGYLQRLGAAEDDLAAAAELYTSLGVPERAAVCVHNLGFVALRSGDIPRALALFDRAADGGLRTRGRAEALVDRAYALLGAGMIVDAGEALARAGRQLDDAGRGMRLAEATVALGQCALRAGRHDLALGSAHRARRLFRAQRRAAWSAVAEALEIRVRLATGADDPATVAAARRAALRCVRHGWRIEAAELRLATALVADRPTARRLLGLVQAERAHGPARLRAAGWLARARLSIMDGNRRGAFAACRAGLRVVDAHAAIMGSLELQAGVAELGAELADTALAAAITAADPAGVLRWTEHYRAAVLRVTPVRPPRDPAVAAALVELRSAELEGNAPLRRLEALEGTVRRLSLAAAGTRDSGADRVGLPVGELTERLGHAALLSFLLHDGMLMVAAVVDGRVRLRRLAEAARVFAEADALRLAVGRHARTGRAGTELLARQSARRLDRALFGPLRTLIADRPLVVVPTGGLHGLPWAAMDTCAGRPVSVAPSASFWLRAASAPEVVAPPVWVAGPGLEYADREVAGLHRNWGGTLLTSNRSTVDSALAAMDGAGLVHIAAHGHFRQDAPMFSCLRLADGPLYGYDLDGLTRAPRWLVLSACEGALSAVRPSDELIGLATVLLRRGTSALVASTVPVPDQAAVDLVTSLHAHLRAGAGPAAALAAAQAEHGHLGFVCLGAG